MVISAGISCAIPTDWTLGGGFYGNIYLNTGYPITNNGVLTNWCFRSGALGGDGDVKLKVFRPNGDNYDFVGESEFLTATNMFTVYSGSCNISVLEGDIIGYFVSAFTNAGSATQTMGTTTINHVGDIITSTPKSEWGSGYYTMSVYATDLAFEIQLGEYHNLTDNPPNISPQQTVFDISEYPTGDIDVPLAQQYPSRKSYY